MGLSGVSEVSKWSKIVTGRRSPSDTWIDNLNHVWTVCILIIFALAVSKGQFFGDNIQCWFPPEFKGAWESYAKDYCWIKNTYYIPMDDTIPTDGEDREEHEIKYYQWVPLILMFQAFLFKFPNMIWRLFHNGCGINLNKVVEMTVHTQFQPLEKRAETIGFLAKYINKWLDTHREHTHLMVRAHHRLARACCFFCNKRAGTYLSSLSLIIKLLYVINVVLQFFLLNGLLGMTFNEFGGNVLEKLARNEPWRESALFPRITMCDFKIRQLQNILPYTVQCVLPINLYNEKIFAVIWFWLCFMAILTCGNLVHRIVINMINRNRVNYAKKYLKINNLLHSGLDKKLAVKFADNYLRDDGVFLLRMIANDSTEMVVTDLVAELWKLFKKSEKIGTIEPERSDEKEPLT